MKVGLVLPQSAVDGFGSSWSEIATIARQAEAGGIDSLWLIDHFFNRDDGVAVGDETGYHEPWTLLSALAAITTRVELGTLVLSTSFRPAAMLAKMAVTADDVAGGRLILGLGCGWHEPEYDGVRVPVRPSRRTVRGGAPDHRAARAG